MERTLLDMTQDILSEMSSDEVNSISDTTESMQVATIIKNKYFDIVARSSLPEHDKLFKLDPSLDSTSPVLMYVPTGVNDVKWIKYFDSNPSDGSSAESDQFEHDLNLDLESNGDTTGGAVPGFQYVTVLPIEQFLDTVNRFNPSESDVESFSFVEDGNSFLFYYKNDHQPTCCTILSNYYVIFDTYDASQDTTLQSSKTMCFGSVMPTFLMQDSFIPDLDDQQFPLLFNEAKALAFYTLKQMPHAKAEQETKRQWSSVQKNKSKSNKPSSFDQLANFGRTPRTGGYSGYIRL